MPLPLIPGTTRQVVAAFGAPPPPRGANEEVELADIQRLDAEQRQPGARGVWDAQWVAKALVESCDDGAGMHRLLRELYADAAEEGVWYVEVAAQLGVKGGQVSVEAEWVALLRQWAALEAVARLHAAAWEDVDLLQKAALRLQRSLFSSPPSPPPPPSLLLSGCLFVGWEERR